MALIKKCAPFFLFIASLSCLAWTGSWGSIEKAMHRVRSVKADFVQTKTMKILARPLISKGKLVYRAPGSLRWEYTDPLRSLLLACKGEVKHFGMQGNELREIGGLRLQATHAVAEGIIELLGGKLGESKMFFSRLLSNPARIELVPKDEALKSRIMLIKIFPSDRPGVIRSIEINENANSSTHWEFSNITIDEELPDSLFEAP